MVAYHLDLLPRILIHNMLLVSLLYDHKRQVDQMSPEPQPLRLVIDLKVWEFKVKAILALQI